jgi:hypothetical protein
MATALMAVVLEEVPLLPPRQWPISVLRLVLRAPVLELRLPLLVLLSGLWVWLFVRVALRFGPYFEVVDPIGGVAEGPVARRRNVSCSDSQRRTASEPPRYAITIRMVMISEDSFGTASLA